jgi:hypothetical protein
LELAGRLEIIVPSRRRGGVHRLVQVRVARLEHTLIGRGGAIRGHDADDSADSAAGKGVALGSGDCAAAAAAAAVAPGAAVAAAADAGAADEAAGVAGAVVVAAAAAAAAAVAAAVAVVVAAAAAAAAAAVVAAGDGVVAAGDDGPVGTGRRCRRFRGAVARSCPTCRLG